MGARLDGKVALITGAARGQGREHAERMADAGADIIAVDIAQPIAPFVPYDPATQQDFDETIRSVQVKGRRIIASTVDTRDYQALSEAVAGAVAELGRLDIIVANAGIAAIQPWNEITPEDFRDIMDINVTGTWNTVMAGAQAIIDGGRGGSIILISSAAGLKAQPFMVHYVTSKHAVTGMARAFAAELGMHSIRVNSVHPGSTATAMASGSMSDVITRTHGAHPHLTSMLSGLLPHPMCQPSDIADAVLWLASDESRFVTSAAIPVDGGNIQY